MRPDGALVVQSQNPEHYALVALARQDLDIFYKDEVRFRAELGYPPFRRLAIVTVVVDGERIERLSMLIGEIGVAHVMPAVDRVVKDLAKAAGQRFQQFEACTAAAAQRADKQRGMGQIGPRVVHQPRDGHARRRPLDDESDGQRTRFHWHVQR